MKFQVYSKFQRFIEHLNCKKGFYLRKKFYRDLKKCVISHTYCTSLQISEFNFFLSGVILFRTQMMNTPLLYKQYSSELKETYYILSFMFDKNKMLCSQPSEENAEEFREYMEILQYIYNHELLKPYFNSLAYDNPSQENVLNELRELKKMSNEQIKELLEKD